MSRDLCYTVYAAFAALVVSLTASAAVADQPLATAPTVKAPQLTADLGPDYVPEPGENALVCYQIKDRSAGFVNIAFGGEKIMGKGDSTVTFDIYQPACAAVGAVEKKSLETFQSPDFNGKLDVTVQKIMAVSKPDAVVSGAKAALETRVVGAGVQQSYYLGVNSGENDTVGKVNYAFGYQALQNLIAGEQNIAIGWRALNKLSGAKANVAIGTKALALNQSGYNNTAVGTAALESNTSGFDNAAFGIRALALTTTGTNNTGIGTDAFEENVSGIRNTGIGTYSGRRNKTSSNNTVGGYGSMYHYTSELGHNTAFGVNSLGKLKEGGLNTAIGMNAGVAADAAVSASWFGAESGKDDRQKKDVQNSTAIGAKSFTDADNQISIGNDETIQLRTWGAFTFKKGYPLNGAGVEPGSLFKGVDGNLYFKSGGGMVAKLAG